MCICFRFNLGRLREEFWNTFFFISIFFISLYFGILVAFQEGKPDKKFFICSKIDPAEFRDIPDGKLIVAPFLTGCKEKLKVFLLSKFN